MRSIVDRQTPVKTLPSLAVGNKFMMILKEQFHDGKEFLRQQLEVQLVVSTVEEVHDCQYGPQGPPSVPGWLGCPS